MICVCPLRGGALGPANGTVGLIGAKDSLYIMARFSKRDVLYELIGWDVSEALDPFAHIAFARIVRRNREEWIVVEVLKKVVKVPTPDG